MTLTTFASSSRGNCALISHEGANILIDAGISLRRITCSLSKFGLTPQDLSAVLITHEHSDHICGLPAMMKRYAVPVYAPRGVGSALKRLIPLVDDNLRVLPGRRFEIGGLEITSFFTPHDTPESVGYTFSAQAKKLAFVTDLGHITKEVMDSVTGSDAVLIEANHDREMLLDGSYPYFLKQRILGDRGHLSNKDSGRFAAFLAAHGTSLMILAHLSRENNTPELAEKTVGEALCGAGSNMGVRLDVAPKDEPGEQYEI